MKPFSTIVLCMLLAVSSICAQILPDGTSLTLTGQTNFYNGDIIIGTNGSFTLLTISSNALLTNSGNGFIGFSTSAQNNEVRLISPTGRWFMGTNLFVGTNGSFNRLTISNGAMVVNRDSIIGYNPSAANNEVVVSGPGSLWTNSGQVNLGVESSANRLVISNGGRVSCLAGTLGITGFGPGASNNVATVTGTGSTWNNQQGLMIGNHGNNCRLVISNSAFVNNSFAAIGANDHSSNCEAVVTGPGSTWSNRTDLVVGSLASQARLVVTNGGAVIVIGDVVLGQSSSSTNNRIVVQAGTLEVTNASGAATLNLIHGTNQFNAGLIDADQLRMTDGRGVFEFNGGTLITRGAFITNGPFVLGVSGNSTALWDVRAGVSNYFLNDLYIGSNSSLSQLVVTNSALLNNNNGILGSRLGANSNLAVVAGINSIWSNRNNLDIGGFGHDNQLIISNSGWVTSRAVRLGVDASASNNFAHVRGSGTVWSNATSFSVGNIAPGNRLVIEEGGVVNTDSGVVGDFGSASNNEALVTGPGSVWTNRSGLSIGSQIGGNRLVVSNAAAVHCGSGTLGPLNNAIVTGAGSLWSNQTTLFLNSRADVTDGGWLACTDGYLASSNSFVVLSGPSGWNNLGALLVGYFVNGSALVVSNGSSLLSSNAMIGPSTSLGNNNVVLLTDAGSIWSNRTDLVVGNFGSGNRLVASNGAVVYVGGKAVVGANSSSISNSIVLTGAGTLLQTEPTSDFLIGSNASFNRLVLSNGAVANCRYGYLGYNASSGTNEAVVTGFNSVWNARLLLQIGQSGNGNRLTISNGGLVNCLATTLVTSNNEAIVTGAGSTWINQQDLEVGFIGGGNRLLITNNGLVSVSNSVVLGDASVSPANRLTVDGGTLRVISPGGGGLLDLRNGTNVLNAGLIEAGKLSMYAASSRFEFNGGTLALGNSIVTNGQLFRVGNGAAAATLRLTGDGYHDFSGALALSVSSNAVLTGNGTLRGGLNILSGGTLSPGLSIGKIILSNSPSLQGTVIMEIAKNGAALTNDQIQVVGALTYGGSLTVTHLGPDTLSVGDHFQLFAASSYASVFNNISLPALGPEMIWTNKLLLDGSIEVISIPPGDHFWTNALGGFYAAPANWLLNSVPGPRDNAIFTNNAGYLVHMLGINPQNASAAFNASSGIVTQSLINSSWTLTNSYIVGRDPSAVATVIHGVGFLRVTNTLGNARFVVGEAGRGTYNLNGGDVLADYLFVTNNGPSFTNSTFNFNSGTLTTLHGSSVSQSTDFIIGNASGTAAWMILGGTNTFSIGSRAITIGNGSASRGVVTLTGSGTVWSNSGSVNVGFLGSSNQMFITQGGQLINQSSGSIGHSPGASNNEVWVTGPGSLWTCVGVGVGESGVGSRLVISNGGKVFGINGGAGTGTSSSNNSVLVTGAGSVWSNQFNFNLGYQGASNSMTIASNALVSAPFLTIGTFVESSNNVLIVNDGNLVATNATFDGILDIGEAGQGTLVLNSGNVRADRLALRNGTNSVCIFNGGTLQARTTAVTNGATFAVGDGASAATFELLGSGMHGFDNGLTVRSNSVLKGSGTVLGNLTVLTGGSVSPGASIGKIALSNSPSLQGAVIMEISKNPDPIGLTNDQVTVAGALTYGGSLIVNHLGPKPLASGEKIRLFNAELYAGSFAQIALPLLPPGLGWTNNLLLDGSLEVIGVPLPVIVTVTLSGTNMTISGTNGLADALYTVWTTTNLSLPLSNWVSIDTNIFGVEGDFESDLGITPGEPQRYFRIRIP